MQAPADTREKSLGNLEVMGRDLRDLTFRLTLSVREVVAEICLEREQKLWGDGGLEHQDKHRKNVLLWQVKGSHSHSELSN